jgi:hypothetical protein
MQPETTHPTLHFFRHYAEMVAAMFVGMFALSKPADWLFGALGTSTSDHPVMMLLSMGITMTVPMVAWMRYRGHGWGASNEMAASMLIPTFGAIALLATGAVTGMGSLMTIEHVAMLAGMLVAMLLRRDEYSGAHAHVHGLQEA